ncbi:RIP metalloprotease RseP [candidate division WOR-3 bacterium]|nr:RIP metalloprotease RseP [candidate division WOR-3 bacterium]
MLITILAFLFILAFCITIHEFGHFIVAKLFHIPVEKFSIGFGPPLFRKKIGETDFRIAYFPLGGYVKMAGEEEGKILKTEEESEKSGVPDFYDAPIYKRILVIFAGPLFNIISAIIVLFLTFSIFGVSTDPYTKIQVEKNSYADRAGFIEGDSIILVNDTRINNWDKFIEVLSSNIDREVSITVMRNGREVTKNLVITPDSLGLINLVPPVLGTIKRDGPAYKAGMKMGDKILKINGAEIKTWNGLVDIIRYSKEKSFLFEWQHNGEIKTANITPISVYDPITEDTIRQISVLKPQGRIYLPSLQILVLSTKRTHAIIILTLNTFYQLITGKISRKALGGPIAIAKLSGESAQWGLEFLLGLLVIISINLGLINLFPIPAIDGGQIVISLIETIRRKRFSRKTRIIIQQIGYALILLLIIFVTFNDITR